MVNFLVGAILICCIALCVALVMTRWAKENYPDSAIWRFAVFGAPFGGGFLLAYLWLFFVKGESFSESIVVGVLAGVFMSILMGYVYRSRLKQEIPPR